jgi:hypothetical protein
MIMRLDCAKNAATLMHKKRARRTTAVVEVERLQALAAHNRLCARGQHDHDFLPVAVVDDAIHRQ